MRSLVGMLFCLMVVSGDGNVTGYVGDDVLLPCTCSDSDLNREIRWQTEGKESVRAVVKHTRYTSDFRDEYKDRAELFLSEDSSNCSLLLKNITLEDEGKYKCSFKSGGGQHNYSHVNLTVNQTAPVIVPSPVPTEPMSPDKSRTLCQLMPFVLAAECRQRGE